MKKLTVLNIRLKFQELERKKAGIETLINEEAFLLAKFLRNEGKEWTPRIPLLDMLRCEN